MVWKLVPHGPYRHVSAGRGGCIEPSTTGSAMCCGVYVYYQDKWLLMGSAILPQNWPFAQGDGVRSSCGEWPAEANSYSTQIMYFQLKMCYFFLKRQSGQKGCATKYK